MLGFVRGLCIIAAFVASAASSGHAQTDLTAVKQAVRECVAQTRQEATRRENYDQSGQPPMWRNFDAYVSPDGLLHNNTKFVGEQDGVYRFEKCLADHGFSLGSGASNNAPKPSDTCTQDELVHPGDCWIRLSVWEKQLVFESFRYGWLHSFEFAERQQYHRIGSSHIPFLVRFDASKVIPYFDQLYSVQENRTIGWHDAFDLLFRTQTNPETKDIPGLTALYQKHEKPLFSGYLRKFVPPNKVVVSEYNDAFQPPQGVRNRTVTVTLLSVSADTNTKAVTDFMAALLNIKQCNTLIRETEGYKFHTYFKTDKDKQEEKERAERLFYPQLKLVIEYPFAYDYQQEEFFNGRNELSGNVLLDKGQSVCIKEEGELVTSVNLSQLMLEEEKYQLEFNADYLRGIAANNFINLNRYLIINGLRTVDRDENDPRPGHQYFSLFNADPTPAGVKKILTIGAPQ